jgi:hypothetical protein
MRMGGPKKSGCCGEKYDHLPLPLINTSYPASPLLYKVSYPATLIIKRVRITYMSLYRNRQERGYGVNLREEC